MMLIAPLLIIVSSSLSVYISTSIETVAQTVEMIKKALEKYNGKRKPWAIPNPSDATADVKDKMRRLLSILKL